MAINGAHAVDLFSVSGVTVDAVAENARIAQQQVLHEGQVEALRTMLRKLTLTEDHARLPALDEPMVTRLVRSYEVTNERRSPQRYLAELTVHFDPDRVREELRRAGVRYAETVSPRMLVLPIIEDESGARLWEAPNAWRAGWQTLGWRGRLVDLVLPFGELADISTVTVGQALRGDAGALDVIADRYGASATLVMTARPAPDLRSAAIEVRRFGAEPGLVLRETYAIEAKGREAGVYTGAAASVARSIEQDWIRDNLLDFHVTAAVPVSAALDGLESWLDLRAKLEALTQIDSIEIDSLRRGEARLTLHYLGGEDKLAAALASRDLALLPVESGRRRLEIGASSESSEFVESSNDDAAVSASSEATDKATGALGLNGLSPPDPALSDLLLYE